MNDSFPEQSSKKDTAKIYVLIGFILVLLGTNAYFFFQDKKANDKIVTLSDEKTSMQIEIDKIEAALDEANNSNTTLTKELETEQELARQKIADLREQLRKGQLTQGQLTKAQDDIKLLRYFVTKYTTDIEDLQKRNASLISERDSLKTTVNRVSAKATELEKQNEGLTSQNTELSTKVKAAAAIKVMSISLTPLRIKNSGKETDVVRASTTKKLRVNFSIIDNSLAEKGMHDIFIRVLDPAGNLITSDNNNVFLSEEEELQFTYRTAIEFANDGKLYQIDWANPNSFSKGTYTVVLYADGYLMGKKSIALR